MRIPNNLGFLLLGLYLIIRGVLDLTGGSGISLLLGLLALAAGIIILLQNFRT
jgi:hypothetical protein